MNIIFCILRNVVVEHTVDVIHIDAAGSDIGRNEDRGSACLEGIHNDGSLGLLHVSMQSFYFESVVKEPACQVVHHLFGVTEHHRAGWSIIVQQQPQSIVFASGWDIVVKLFDTV